jgi:hypothetical protein
MDRNVEDRPPDEYVMYVIQVAGKKQFVDGRNGVDKE